jgi:SWI/SNF-related matrix-associated actin-dependent regulator of chromatin subfamily A containing DEAD/H box 1
MNFILPDLLEDSLEALRAVFKAKGDSKVTLLAQERVSRAKKMMTPFVLRRRKDQVRIFSAVSISVSPKIIQVLKELPKKIERIEWCDMTTQQRTIYDEALNRSRKTIFDLESEASTPGTETPVNGQAKPLKKPKVPRTKDKLYLENSSNVLMDLRKAASHPMLFRTRYTDKTLDAVTKVLLKEADFKKRGAVAQYVKEDMEVMTDAELQVFLGSYLVRWIMPAWL